MTLTGMVVGSPGYMSPEQANGREVGPASDVFSLGSVLIFAATGQDPFGGGDASVLLYQVVHTPAALASMPAELRPVVEQCMRKNPAERPTPGDLLAQLADNDTISSWAAKQAPPGESAADVPAPRVPAAPPAGYPQTEAADPAGTHAPRASRPLSAPRTAIQRGTARARPAGRTRRIGLAWTAAAAVILAGAGAGIALAWNPSGTPGPSRSPSVSRTVTAKPAPEAVVKAYLAAINAHDWRKVWQLGGKNLGQTYTSMVTGFRDTSHDVLISLTTAGDSVSARIRAYETTGTVQTYALTYTVSDGVIISGRQKLLSP